MYTRLRIKITKFYVNRVIIFINIYFRTSKYENINVINTKINLSFRLGYKRILYF